MNKCAVVTTFTDSKKEAQTPLAAVVGPRGAVRFDVGFSQICFLSVSTHTVCAGKGHTLQR